MFWLALAAAVLAGAIAAAYFLYRLVLGAPFEDGSGFRGSLKRVAARLTASVRRTRC
jgi:hypothetical protein